MATQEAPTPPRHPAATPTDTAAVGAPGAGATAPRSNDNRRRQLRQAVARAIAKLRAAVDAMANGRNYNMRELARVLERALTLVRENPRTYRSEISGLQRAITELQVAQRATGRGNQNGNRRQQERPLPAIEELQVPAPEQPDEGGNDASSAPSESL